jgi:hypothetical protein
MDANAQRVLDEAKRFRALLPELLRKYDGRWVIFRDGDVAGDFDEEEQAFVAAVGTYGVRGGFVIALVTADALEPVPVSAALFFAP